MCGIAAIFAYESQSPSVDREELLRIREAMRVRGPDGSGSWLSQNGRVGLAHRRLAIIDLSESGAQPMSDESGRLHITFNGEIYNYRTLRAELEAKGYRFRSTSDTEVLLYLYAEKGQNMVQHLRGMYAFALWDEQQQGLFLARDPFGIKPLYYADDGKTLRVASQVKALLQGGGISTSPETAGQVGFFLWGHVPEPYTLYKEITALPAGSSLWIGRSGKKILNKFCEISTEIAKCSPATSGTKDQQAQSIQALHDALFDSVRHHLLADVPVGVFLSSGIDSTTLTALVSEVAPASLRTVTLGFKEYEGTANDETPLSERVARQYGAEHQTKWISRHEFQDCLDHILKVMDQPSVDGVNTYFVSKVTAETGLKVALSGLGGDELFGGYNSFHQIPKLVHSLKWLSNFPRIGQTFRWISAPVVKQMTSPKYAGIFEYSSSYAGAYLLRRGLFMPWELPEILDAEIVKEGLEKLQTLENLHQTFEQISDDRLKVSALESCWYMRSQLLRDSDWAGMAHSLELRVPLVDIALLRNILHLGQQYGFLNKSAFAETPAQPLPREVVTRRKTGFSILVQSWSGAQEDRGLREWAKTIFKAFQ